MEQVLSELPSDRFPTYYQYESLDSSQRLIRLLHLQPGTSNEPIECHLETVDLRSKPKYEALSYEWGDPNIFQPDIKLGQSLVPVRNNLWWALHHLRLHQSTRILWIDALCINQNNISERNNQVSEMKRIYSHAFQVVAWIGREEDSSGECLFHETKTAMNFLFTLASHPLEDFPYSLGLEEGKSSLIFSSHASKWDALCIMLNRKYWRRLWIIQEFILAPEVLLQCGSWSIPWTVCSSIFAHLTEWSLAESTAVHPRLLTSLSYQMDKRRKERQAAQDPGDSQQGYDALLADLVTEFGEALCLDPRDKIFGLLSLSRSCCRDSITVNYSTTLITVCAELLEHHVSQHCSESGRDTVAESQSVLNRLGLLPLIPTQADNLSRMPAFSCKTYLEPIRGYENHFQALLNAKRATVLLPIGGWYRGTIIELYIPKQNVASSTTSLSSKQMFALGQLLFMMMFRGETQHSLLPRRETGWQAFFHPNSSFQTLSRPRNISEVSSVPLDLNPLLVPLAHISQQSGAGAWLSSDDRLRFLREEKLESSTADLPNFEKPKSCYGTGGVDRRRFKLTVQEMGHVYELLGIECGVAFFLTSSGLAGCVTNNVKLGDRVFELSGPGYRVAVLNENINSLSEVVGKGRVGNVIGTDPAKRAPIQTIKIDVAALLYLIGCF